MTTNSTASQHGTEAAARTIRPGKERKHKLEERDFAGSPVVKTPDSHCRGHGSDPQSGNQDPTCCVMQSKKKERKKINWKRNKPQTKVE